MVSLHPPRRLTLLASFFIALSASIASAQQQLYTATLTTPTTSEPAPAPAPMGNGADKIKSLADAPVAETLKNDIEPKKPSHWRLGAGYAPILGMKADFVGSSNVPTAPNTPGQNREYLDGYVRVDSRGNDGGETTFWGYSSAAQEVGGNGEFAGNIADPNKNGIPNLTTWTDLARSTAGQPFTLIESGTGIAESGTGNTRSVIITGTRRFMRLSVAPTS